MRLLFSKRSIFSTLGLALVVGVTSWISIQSAQNYQDSSVIPGDFVINTGKGVTFHQLNEEGKIKYILHADTIERMEDGHARMQQVKLEMYSADAGHPPWILTSKTAEITKHNEEINLQGNVVLSQAKYGQQKPIRMTTTQVYVYPKKSAAKTNKPVKIVELDSKNIMTGVGMKAEFNPSVITVLSQVRTYYESEN